MDDLRPMIEKLPSARTRCTLVISEEERGILERKVLEQIAKTSRVRGFRTGRAPMEIIREQTKPATLMEEIIHAFLQERLPTLLREQKLAPIIHPRVELVSHAPITLVVTIVEKPNVRLRGKDALRIAKHDTAVTDDDVAGTREQAERMRREKAFFAQVPKITDVDLAPELLEAEERHMLDSLQERLRAQNIPFAEWLRRTGKEEEAFRRNMREEAERRLRLRFGIDALLSEHQITVEDATGEKGDDAATRWQRNLQKLLAVFLD